METFALTKGEYFGTNDFTGCGISVFDGKLYYPVEKSHNIIDKEISKKAKEVIVILDISNNGTKKEIRFLVDGKESKSSDVSEHLKGNCLFPAICLLYKTQQVTTVPIDQIEIRTPEIENLIKEYQQIVKEKQQLQFKSSEWYAQFQSEISSLSFQLQREKQKNSDLEKENEQLKQQQQQLSSSEIAQLQKDLADALQKITALSSQLQREEEK